MLTIVKVTTTSKRGAGYEPFNDFCLVRDGNKYQNCGLYVAKILNRFEDCKGNIHFVVKPISDTPVTCLNYDFAQDLCRGTESGLDFVQQGNFSGIEYEDCEDYDDIVQAYLAGIAMPPQDVVTSDNF